MKRELRSIHDMKIFTPAERNFNNWKMQQMFELGLACNYDSCDGKKMQELKIKIFGSEIKHMEAERIATEYLNSGQAVPEELRVKLLKYKNLINS